MICFIGGVVGAISNSVGSAIQMFENRRIMQKQHDFQERMRDTAHQAEVKDLRAAGLNPILSAKLGGAAVPPGGMIAAPELGQIGSNAVAAIRQSQEAKLAKERIVTEKEKQHDSRANRDHQSFMNQEITQRTLWMAQQEKSTARDVMLKQIQARMLMTKMPGMKKEQQIDEGKWGQFFRYWDRAIGGTKSAGDLLKR